MANSIVNAAAGMLLLVTGFFCSIVAARLLGPDANGIIAFSLWFATTGALVAELGTGIILLRMMPKLRAEGYDAARRRGFAALLVTPTIVSTVVLAGLYAALFLSSEELHWAKTAPSIALVTGILFVTQSIGAFAKNYLIGEQRLGTFFKLTAIASVLQMATVVAGALYFGVEGALVGYAVGQFVLFLYTLSIVFHQRDRCGVPMRFLISSSLILSAEFVIDSIFLNRLEIFFLQQFWSVEVVGYYAVSLSLANLALQLPIQLTGSLLPYYSQQRHSSDDRDAVSAEVFSGVIRALSYITLPMSFGLAAISTELVTAVFGEAFRPAGMIVALLALSSPAYVLVQILTQYLFSIDKAKSRLITSLIAAAVLVVGCLAVVPWFGGEGAAIIRLGVFSLMCIMMIGETGFGKSLGSLYRTLAKVTAASVAIAAIANLTIVMIPGLKGLLLAIAAGVVFYPLSLRYLKAVPAVDRDALINLSGSFPAAFQIRFRQFILFVSPYLQFERDLSSIDMAKFKRDQENALLPAEGAGLKAALPVVFAESVGLYMPENQEAAPRAAAVLILSPWGFEEMCTRKYFRIMAEHMAASGMPSLRFDYPATGDALDGPRSGVHLSDWEASVLAAAEKLKQMSGRDKIILVGQGVGGLLAERLAGRIAGVQSVALLAPVLSGRTYFREVALWSKVVDQGLGLREDQRDRDGVTIASLKMPPMVAAELQSIDVGRNPSASARRYFLLERAVRLGNTDFADALQASGADVRVESYDGYDELVANPTIQKMPMEAIAKVLGWLRDVNPIGEHGPAAAPAIASGELAGDGFIERPFRFGEAEHLYGMLCVPRLRTSAASVLILTTAYDRGAGWGRMSVAIARSLAAQGIASFRYDAANVGDSAPAGDAPSQVLYSPTQIKDVISALDLMEKQLGGDFVVAGRCSGGYLALRAGVQDARIRNIISVNPYVFYWDPEKPVHDGLQFLPRSLQDYGHRFARLETYSRVLTGRVNLAAAAKNVTLALYQRVANCFGSLIRHLPMHNHVHREVMRTVRGFEERDVGLSLIYSEGDIGLHDLYLHFGDHGSDLRAFNNVRLTMLPDTDHNITPLASRQTILDEIFRLARLGHEPSVAQRVEKVLHLREEAG